MNTDDDDKLDLSAWDVDEPPSGFAERVVTAARRERTSAEPRREREEKRDMPERSRLWLAASVAIGLAASTLFYVANRDVPKGEVSADDQRKEVKIGDRAVAVLEPGASLKWVGTEVDQTRGEIFYRVERGDGFRVHTALGNVDVQGTCFRVDLRGRERTSEMQTQDWKAAAIGAAVATALIVSVYEGKVAVSHANERVSLAPGQSVTATDGTTLAVSSQAPGAGAASEESALENANKNLVGSVSELKNRLEMIEGQKKSLEAKLVVAEEKLEVEKRGGDAAPKKSEFDLSQDDLVALAKEGTLKYRAPCTKRDYRPDAETLQKLSLSPQDGDTIAAAYKKVAQFRELQMRPACQEVLGKSELSEKMSLDGCMHLVADLLSDTDPKARREAQQHAVDIRAGLKPTPGPNEKVAPLTRMMVASGQQLKIFEDELAKTMGPEEAHRLAFADGLCMGLSTWGGEPPKKN